MRKSLNLLKWSLVLVPLATATAFQSELRGAPLEDLPTLLRRVESSMVRIEIIGLDGRLRPIPGKYDFGHGIFIDKKAGLVLTAAHVLLPNKNWLVGAATYEIVVWEFSIDDRDWVRRPERIYGHSLTPYFMVGDRLNVADCPQGSSFGSVPCLDEDPIREFDIALLRISEQPIEEAGPGFVDIIGPFDHINEASDEGWELYVVSDFNRTGIPQPIPVKPVDNTLFYTDTNKTFHGGVSGSPLILFASKDRDKAVFVAGLAIRNVRENEHQVITVLLSEFMTDSGLLKDPQRRGQIELSELRRWVPNPRVFECERRTSYDSPLFHNYLSYWSTSGSKRDTTKITKCFGKHSPWKTTGDFIRFFEISQKSLSESKNKVASAAESGVDGQDLSTLQVAFQKQYYHKSPILRTLLRPFTTSADAGLSNTLEQAYEKGLDPLLLMDLAHEKYEGQPGQEMFAIVGDTIAEARWGGGPSNINNFI